jgi:hypothetical protein
LSRLTHLDDAHQPPTRFFPAVSFQKQFSFSPVNCPLKDVRLGAGEAETNAAPSSWVRV